jgi:hypothetical protein
MIIPLMLFVLLCIGVVVIQRALKQLGMRVSSGRSRPTIGEIVFAIVLSLVVASLAAVVGFFGAAVLCAKLLSGESGEAVLVLAPATAFALALVAFSICFQRIITYGENS